MKFQFRACLTHAGIQRAHHYRNRGGGKGEGTFVPELHIVLDANQGDGFSSDRNRGSLNLYLTEPDIVRQIAALWWERGLQTFDHKPDDWKDPGRVRFTITVEQEDVS